jgi:ribulose-phosphate 3-epimerase
MILIKLRIAPSLLAADFTRLGEQIIATEAAGADLLHIDVMDGRFVPNISMGQFIVEAVRRVATLPLDVHLMIVEPDQYLKSFADAGAAMICVHYEACPHLHRTLQQIRDLGCKAGVALNPHTPARSLSEIMDMIDFVNVMTVNPGFGGQHFLTSTMSKVARLRAMMGETGRELDLEVDGGINAETASTAVQAGANVLIAGTSIFNPKFGVKEGMDALRGALQ